MQRGNARAVPQASDEAHLLPVLEQKVPPMTRRRPPSGPLSDPGDDRDEEPEEESMKPYCECPTEGNDAAPAGLFEPDELKTRVHAPSECRGVMDLAEYRRGAAVLTLCSTCHLSGDQRLP